MKRQFGFYHIEDKRDKKFTVSTEAAETDRISRYWYTSRYFGDQGNKPHCVGYGWAHWLAAQPIEQFLNPDGIYQLAQHLDEWEGTNYDGTSVRGGAKVLHKLGAIQSYKWANTLNQVVNTVLNTGPMVIGIQWYEGMSNPFKGLMRPTGRVEGGHCVIITGVNKRKQLFKVKNSWGKEWGVNGFAHFNFTDFEKIMAKGGEFCIGIEKKITYK